VVLLGPDVGGVHRAPEQVEQVRKVPGVAGVAAFTYSKAMVFREGLSEGMVVKGVDLVAERGVTTVGQHIEPPLDSIPLRTADGLPAIVLGAELAARIGARVGDKVLLATLTDAKGSAFGFAPKIRPFRVAGLFRSGLYTYDSSFGFTAIGTSQEFFELGSGVTGIEVRLVDMFDAPSMADRLMRVLEDPTLRANNWIELNRNLFTWMKLEKAVMFVILGLIVLVAAFNIVSTLFMVVIEKRRDIGVLKTLGATDRSVLHVFLFEGLLIGGLGTGLGVVLGFGLIEVLRRYPLVRLPSDVYFIETLPVRPEAADFAAVILAALVLCLAAAVYPAWRASRLRPVEAIREHA
jgi:lipoprotein-releasing system permease protein